MNTIFTVGDRVYFPYFGLGNVTEVSDKGGYPVKVIWVMAGVPYLLQMAI